VAPGQAAQHPNAPLAPDICRKRPRHSRRTQRELLLHRGERVAQRTLLAGEESHRRGLHAGRAERDLVFDPRPLRRALVADAAEQLAGRLACGEGEQATAQVLGPRLELRVGRLDRIEERQQLRSARLQVRGGQGGGWRAERP
jgi:hypothetical protein